MVRAHIVGGILKLHCLRDIASHFQAPNAPTQLPTEYHTGSAAMGAVGLGEDIAEIYVGIRMPLLLHRMSSYEAQHAQPNARQFLKNETKVAMLCRNNIVDKSILRVA